MEITEKNIKQYLIDNGIKKTVGFGKNKITVYVLENKKVFAYNYYISSDGSKAFYNKCKIYNLRYNETRDIVQSLNIYFGYHSEWKWLKLTFKNGLHIFTTTDEAKEYVDVFYRNNIEKVKDIISSNITKLKLDIKRKQREIKVFEKKLESINYLDN